MPIFLLFVSVGVLFDVPFSLWVSLRRNNFRILGINEDPRESWEECGNKIYELVEEKLEMNTINISIERSYRVGEKSNDRERAIVVQFSFYKDEINIFRNCKKLMEIKISIFENFLQETIQIHGNFLLKLSEINFHVYRNNCSLCGKDSSQIRNENHF